MSDSGKGDSGGGTIDQQQRWNDIQEMVQSSGDTQQSNMWTSIPAIVKKHNDNGTVSVQVAIKQKHIKQDGKAEWLEHPPLTQVPLQYPGGGGASWTFPVKEGDEVLLCCASRNVDKWFKDGGVQEQIAPFRMHDMNDAFAIPGFRSQKRKLSEVSMKTAQLRTDDGKMVIEFDPESKQITIKSPDKPVRIEGGLEVTGEVKVGGDVKGGKEVFAHAGTNNVKMKWTKSHPVARAAPKDIDPDARGYWQPAINVPDLTAPVTAEDLDFWVTTTQDPLVPEYPVPGAIPPGLEGILIHDDGKIIWHLDTGLFTYEPPLTSASDDEPWVGILDVEVFDSNPFSVVGDITTAITKVDDIFHISGAINAKFPQLSAVFNGAFKVFSLINSGNFSALVTAIPSLVGLPGVSQIIGNPIVQAAIKLATHDHHGVRTGKEISDKPVAGT